MRIIGMGFLLVSLALPAYAQNARTAEQAALGRENHPKVLAKFGGEIGTVEITEFVDDLGRELVRYSDQPRADWTFTVLDTPVVNAFAVSGGYIYVTRGLLALVDDEAELAAVLSHEIGHVTADHLGDRDDANGDALRNGLLSAVIGGIFSNGEDRLGNAIKSGVMATFEFIGDFSQQQELEADRLGIAMMIEAGYDPYAAADFLASLSAQHELEALISGREYSPNTVAFFATHPADADRVRDAVREAEQSGASDHRSRNQVEYYDLIDGMIYGDVAAQGFVRGRRFMHPTMLFAYEVPEGFMITNAAQAVRAKGPNGATMVLTGGRAPEASLTRYIEQGWARQIGQKQRVSPLEDMREFEIDGMEAATAILPISGRNGRINLRLTVIRRGDTMFRISGGSREGDDETFDAILAATQTFRNMDQAEAARMQPYRIEIRRAGRRDTVEKLAEEMPFATLNEERFRTLNGLDDDEEIERGDYVKMIVE